MKKVFIVIGLIVLWIMAWFWLKSPQGVRQVDRILDCDSQIYALARQNMQGR